MIKSTLCLIFILCLFPTLLCAQNSYSLHDKAQFSDVIHPNSEFRNQNFHFSENLNFSTSDNSQFINPDLFDLTKTVSSVDIQTENALTFSFDSDETQPSYSKGRAMGYAALMPGAGHLYMKRSRGYLYLAGSLIAAGMYVESYLRFLDTESKKNSAVNSYNAALNTDSATFFRSEVFRLQDEEKKFQDMSYISLGLFGAIYAAQLIDLYLTTPSKGSTQRSGSRFQAGVAPGVVQLNVTF